MLVKAQLFILNITLFNVSDVQGAMWQICKMKLSQLSVRKATLVFVISYAGSYSSHHHFTEHKGSLYSFSCPAYNS